LIDFDINFLSFKPDTENNANFENYTSHCLATWCRAEKKTKILIKSLNVKVTTLDSL